MVLCLDVGDKYVGVAHSDEHGLLASPAPPVLRDKGSLALGQFKRLFKECNATLVIVGLPLNMDETVSHQAKKTRAFVAKLKKHFPEICFEWVDERLSTWDTKEKYRHLNLGKAATEKNIDSFTAMEMLQQYLDNRI